MLVGLRASDTNRYSNKPGAKPGIDQTSRLGESDFVETDILDGFCWVRGATAGLVYPCDFLPTYYPIAGQVLFDTLHRPPTLGEVGPGQRYMDLRHAGSNQAV